MAVLCTLYILQINVDGALQGLSMMLFGVFGDVLGDNAHTQCAEFKQQYFRCLGCFLKNASMGVYRCFLGLCPNSCRDVHIIYVGSETPEEG